MPPTWVVLATVYLRYNLLFFPTVLIGVVAATFGRVVLALLARKWFRRFLPEKFLNNYLFLGDYLKKNQSLTLPVVFGYAFSPISSNSLFIMAGLSDIRIDIIAASFFSGRLLTYSFWLLTSRRISHGSTTGTIISAVVSLLIIWVIGKINWKKLLK